MDNLTKPGANVAVSDAKSDQNPRSNPVCLEVSVTIRSLPGERSEASPGSAQPTREEARTVIVFDNGAVLRLASNFPPGQAVILSNSQGRDVVCRVVSTRNLPNVKGYIEVEFLEPTTDFWGIHKPEAQSHPSNPPAPAVAPPPKSVAPPQPKPVPPPQPKSVAPPQNVPSAPPLEPPATIRVAPAVPEPIVALGKAPSFEDIADALPALPPPVARSKSPESTPRIPASRIPNDSTQSASEATRSYSAAGTSRPADELTSLSGTWDGTPAPARTPPASGDVLGKFATPQNSTSNGLSGKMPLMVGGAAAIVVVLGAIFFFTRQGSPAAPSPVPVAAVSKPASSEPSVPVRVPTPAAIDQPMQEKAPDASPLPPAIVPASSAAKEIMTTSAPAVQQTPRRQANAIVATQTTPLESKQLDAPILQSPVARNLKMSAPTAESQSGRLVDSSVPTIEDATASGTNRLPGGLMATASRAVTPPPPPVGFPTAVSSGNSATEPKLISSTRPAYPLLAKQGNVEGDVIVAADIDASGKVVAAKATSGPMYLRQAAVDAVRNWKYEPATLNGKPTSTQISVKMQFRLNVK